MGVGPGRVPDDALAVQPAGVLAEVRVDGGTRGSDAAAGSRLRARRAGGGRRHSRDLSCLPLGDPDPSYARLTWSAASVLRARRLHLTPVMGREPTRPASLRVLVLPPAARLGGLWFRRPLEQEAEVGRDERVRRGDCVGVVDGPVVAREGDPARVFAQPVFQLGPDLEDGLRENPGWIAF